MSIRLSKKHGLNPTTPICFFCGSDRNAIAILGALKGDAEAPRHMVLDYRPCDKCASHMSKGITIIEVSEYVKDNSMPISKDDLGKSVYPTGYWAVLSEEGAGKMFPALKLQKGAKVCAKSDVCDILRELQAKEKTNDEQAD